ncbi:MAG: hypothetical protein ACI95R_000750, partial [Halioglobus sp.]
ADAAGGKAIAGTQRAVVSQRVFRASPKPECRALFDGAPAKCSATQNFS